MSQNVELKTRIKKVLEYLFWIIKISESCLIIFLVVMQVVRFDMNFLDDECDMSLARIFSKRKSFFNPYKWSCVLLFCQIVQLLHFNIIVFSYSYSIELRCSLIEWIFLSLPLQIKSQHKFLKKDKASAAAAPSIHWHKSTFIS